MDVKHFNKIAITWQIICITKDMLFQFVSVTYIIMFQFNYKLAFLKSVWLFDTLVAIASVSEHCVKVQNFPNPELKINLTY